MARFSFLEDFLNTHAFFLFDVGPIDSIGLPVFTPIFGFSSITSPEITHTVKEFKEANNNFSRKIITGAKVSPISMQRGSIFYDSDFWRWIVAAIEGDTDVGLGISGPTPRKDLLLVHFFSRGPFNDHLANAVVGGIGLTALVGGAGLAGGSSFLAAAGIAATDVAAIGAFAAIHPREIAVRIPAKAWLLKSCLPVRYKPASNFDASTSAISLMELDVEYERVEEISLAQ